MKPPAKKSDTKKAEVKKGGKGAKKGGKKGTKKKEAPVAPPVEEPPEPAKEPTPAPPVEAPVEEELVKVGTSRLIGLTSRTARQMSMESISKHPTLKKPKKLKKL